MLSLKLKAASRSIGMLRSAMGSGSCRLRCHARLKGTSAMKFSLFNIRKIILVPVRAQQPRAQ
jgi:hypothetical protein